MPGELHLQTDLRVGGRVKARPFSDGMRELEILSRLRAGPGILITRDRTGMSISARRQSLLRGGGGADVALAAFKLNPIPESVQRDYLVCRDEEDNGVKVLKAQRLRISLNEGTITRGGQSIILAEGNAGNQSRRATLASDATKVESFRVIPTWETDDLIWCVQIPEDQRLVADPNAEPPVIPEWLDLNDDGRAWAAIRGPNEIAT